MHTPCDVHTHTHTHTRARAHTHTHTHTHTHAHPYLQFLQCEPSSSSYFSVVPECGTPNHWSERSSHGAGGNSCCLLQTLLSSSLLLAWLVEPRPHIALPVLLEVSIGQHSIASGGHLDLPEEKIKHTCGGGRRNRGERHNCCDSACQHIW